MEPKLNMVEFKINENNESDFKKIYILDTEGFEDYLMGDYL